MAGLSSFNIKMQVPSDMSNEDKYLINTNFNTQQYLNQISKWTDEQQMKLNCLKTKYMIINFCRSSQFQTRLYLNDNLLQQVKVTPLLGVLISDDLRWNANTDAIVAKANKRMTIIRNLINFNVADKDLIHIYVIFIRSVLEQSCVVWGSSITESEAKAIERIQKCCLYLIYKDKYVSYENALQLAKLPKLDERRAQLSLRFALKCAANEKTKHMFPLNPTDTHTRHTEKYQVPFAYHNRLKNSAIPVMARQLNEHYRRKAQN